MDVSRIFSHELTFFREGGQYEKSLITFQGCDNFFWFWRLKLEYFLPFLPPQKYYFMYIPKIVR